MLLLRFILRIVAVFIIICAATQNLPPSKYAKTYAQAQRIDDDYSSSEETNSNIIAGNGYSLPPNLKTVTIAERHQNLPVNWYDFWYGKQMTVEPQQQQWQRQMRQQTIQQKHKFKIKNVAFPFEGPYFPNVKESSQRKVIVPNSRCRRNARNCDYNDLNKYEETIQSESRNDRKDNSDYIEQSNSRKTYTTFARNLFHLVPVKRNSKSSAIDYDEVDNDDDDDQSNALYGFPEQNVNADFSDIIRSQDYKRHELNENEHLKYQPSISGVSMTNLGEFFKQLSRNVQFIEKSELNKVEGKLLHGDHPLKTLHEKVADKHEVNAEFLNAVRTYRPQQKIRSMISKTPYGYHGWKFIDPNYMWIGLGK